MYNLSTINEYKLHNKNTPIENLLYYTEESIYITEGAGIIAIIVAIIAAIIVIIGVIIKKLMGGGSGGGGGGGGSSGGVNNSTNPDYENLSKVDILKKLETNLKSLIQKNYDKGTTAANPDPDEGFISEQVLILDSSKLDTINNEIDKLKKIIDSKNINNFTSQEEDDILTYGANITALLLSFNSLSNNLHSKYSQNPESFDANELTKDLKQNILNNQLFDSNSLSAQIQEQELKNILSLTGAGDGQKLSSIDDGLKNFIYSSNCNYNSHNIISKDSLQETYSFIYKDSIKSEPLYENINKNLEALKTTVEKLTSKNQSGEKIDHTAPEAKKYFVYKNINNNAIYCLDKNDAHKDPNANLIPITGINNGTPVEGTASDTPISVDQYGIDVYTDIWHAAEYLKVAFNIAKIGFVLYNEYFTKAFTYAKSICYEIASAKYYYELAK